MIRLSLLGPTTCLDSAGAELDRIVRSPKRLALLSYLAVATPRGFHRRDTLLGLLWPESDQRRARAALRQTLRHLRDDLGGVLVSRGQEELGLDWDRFWCDAAAFEAALAAGRSEEAVDLYRGDLLAGFYLPGAPEFERWLDEARLRLRRLGAEAGWALADGSDHPIEGARWARKAAAFTPHDETAVRRLMDFLAERGDEIGALREYERFRKRTHQDLGVSPGPETRALAGVIRGRTESADSESVSAPSELVPEVERSPSREAEASAGDSHGPDTATAEATQSPALDQDLAAAATTTTRRTGVRAVPRFAPGALVAGISLAVIVTFGARAVIDRETPGIRIGDARQITRANGLEIDPVLSPDGTQIAFAAGTPGVMEIFVRRTAGGRELALTLDLPGNHRWPTWSPDGERLAFVTLAADGASTLHVLPALGGAARRVHEEPPPLSRAISSPTWAPDGSRIAFKTDRVIRILDLETGEIDYVAEAWAPHSFAWGPGGAIAFVSENGSYALGPHELGNIAPSSIWIVSSEGGEPVPVVADGMLNQSPTWGPEGRHLIFVSNRSGPRDVYAIPMSGDQPVGETVRLTTHLEPLTISLSGDGDVLAYSKLGFDMNIYTAPLAEDDPVDFGAATRLTDGHQVIETLDVSPDGRWIAFDSNRGGNQDIYRVPLDGGDALRLTRHEADDFAPRWSPDGREIAFYSFRNGQRDVYVIDAEGLRAERVTTDPGSDAFPDWSPDGNALVYQNNPSTGASDIPNLYIVDRAADGRWGAPRRITESVSEIPRWSPTADLIAYATRGGLRILDLATGESRALETGDHRGFGPLWSADGGNLYYRVANGEARGIWSLELGGGEPIRLLTDPSRRSPRGTFDTDGERLFFLGIDAEEADIWIADLEWP